MPKTTIGTKATGQTLTAAEFNELNEAHNNTIDNLDPDATSAEYSQDTQYTYTEGDPIAFSTPVSESALIIQNTTNWDYETDYNGCLVFHLNAMFLNPSGAVRAFLVKLQVDTGAGYADTKYIVKQTMNASEENTVSFSGVQRCSQGDKFRFIADLDPNATPEIIRGVVSFEIKRTP